MRPSCILISSAASILIISDIASAAESIDAESFRRSASTSYRKAIPHAATRSNDSPIQSRKTFKTNDLNAPENRMFDGALRAIRGVEFSNLEHFERWIFRNYTPAQVRAIFFKEESISNILQGELSEQYLKFIVEYERNQRPKIIPKPASEMQKYELWLYAGLQPQQVREDILKIEMGQSVWKHDDVNEYLLYLVEYKRRQSGSRITKEASKMQMSELWIHAGLTPTLVRNDIMKVGSENAHLRAHRYYHQFETFCEKYYDLYPNAEV